MKAPSLNVIRSALAIGLTVSLVASAAAQSLSPGVSQLRDQWAVVSYQTPKAQRAAAFESLATQAAQVQKSQPKDPAALIWEGIVLSSWAGDKGGMGALSLVKQAKSDLEAALKLDPHALDGSAYTSLGALYYQVPGWPIGFGDDATAKTLLLKGLEINPNGIDANYFYGDFLRDQKDWQGAQAALTKALSAPDRPGRKLADEGRRQEIQAKLAQVRQHLAKH